MTKEKSKKSGYVRPPIVTILGHVDHGKTTLLDSIRSSNVASREAGGITQGIGASVVKTKDGKDITFIDTPGHAAFGKMRSRGANVADIAILVVAVNDGVKPQTTEALKFIKEAKVPFIVAATKIDLKDTSVDAVYDQLKHEEVSFEGRGGDVPLIPVSGTKGKGIDELLEMIILMSEVIEIKSDPESGLEAVVIETSKEKGGLVASLIVRNGTLSVGQEVGVDGVTSKVRALFDDKKVRTKQVLPGYPTQVLGFTQLPEVGSVVTSGSDKKAAVELNGKSVKDAGDNIPVVLKAGNAGFIEAVEVNLPQGVTIINSSVGDVNESDIFIAKSSGAVVAVLDSKVSGSARKLAKTEKVEVIEFKIIYKLFEALEELVIKDQVPVLGKAEVLDSFPYNKKKVAGCKVLEGRISRSDKFILMRGEEEIGGVRAASMRRGKEEIDTAKPGEDFGIILRPQLDFEVGDMILSVAIKK